MRELRLDTFEHLVPQCYAYVTPGVAKHEGWTKIGYTTRDVEERILEQTRTVGLDADICWSRLATYTKKPFGTFTDKEFHAYLEHQGIEREPHREWFHIDPDTAEKLFADFSAHDGHLAKGDAPISYRLRKEQEEAVSRTLSYFKTHDEGKFLWNAKPRFGKTLAAYDLIKRLGAEKVLVITNRPAVAQSWVDDYNTFLGPSSGYVFVSHLKNIQGAKNVYTREEYLKSLSDEEKNLIEFVSLQDIKGSIYFGGEFDKLSELRADGGIHWDLLIIDESHEGVATEKTDVALDRIKRKATLHLSGTPFKDLANQTFPEEAIYNWTYADEQGRKASWGEREEERGEENPYETLPELQLYTYQMSEVLRDTLLDGVSIDEKEVEKVAFDLNEFFSTKENGEFVYDDAVNKFLDALTKNPRFPFSTDELRAELAHTFWLLDRVNSAKALAKKLQVHPYFKDYKVVVAAGDGRTEGMDEEAKQEHSLKKVRDAIANKENAPTITLSVGQLTTGVTVPEWTAVLMLCNMTSPALYMQAAFRAQNPWVRPTAMGMVMKKRAYVFDFDPARTLTIFDEFANDLIPAHATGHLTQAERKDNVRELLNFFPVYGEDEEGEMVLLDAERVLTIPRRIHAREVVDRGFMSNFLFANIGAIFSAPKEVVEVINRFQPVDAPKSSRPLEIDENTRAELYLNDKGEVEMPEEVVIGLSKDIFGEKIYSPMAQLVEEKTEELQDTSAEEILEKKNPAKDLTKLFAGPMTDIVLDTLKEKAPFPVKTSTANAISRSIHDAVGQEVREVVTDYTVEKNQRERAFQKRLQRAQEEKVPMAEIAAMREEHEKGLADLKQSAKTRLKEKIETHEFISSIYQDATEIGVKDKSENERKSYEDAIRDHLRGFSRTIPAFLMAYGTEDTTLANFDSLVPDHVFLEVTYNPQAKEGITLKDFRLLRDGGEFKKDGEIVHFPGHLFDEVVFNDAVAEFMRRKKELANYFDESQEKDIFDYIPPQRTNQIFTPRAVVKEMADLLEKENPGCFGDPEATFADLYMKSGMYITEIVKRLFRSEAMKARFPDDHARLIHIFNHQVYGCAPTELIYKICENYILGFSEELPIKEHHIRHFDALECLKGEESFEEALQKVFGISKSSSPH